MIESRIAQFLNYTASLILIIFAIVYIFKNEFMPYHKDIVGKNWSEVKNSNQILILALMRLAGTGFLISSLVIFFLQKKFSKMPEKWLNNFIFLIGTTVFCGSIYCTIFVKLNSAAQPPILITTIGGCSLLIAFLLNNRFLKNL